jgi:hypothetical protein
MAKPYEKLAESLDVLHKLQERGLVAIRSGDLTRTHRELIEKGGLRLFSLPAALITCSSRYFKQNPNDIRAALSKISDAS